MEVDKKVKRKEGLKASMSQNNLIVEGNRYTYERLSQFAENLQPEASSTYVEDDMVAFWEEASPFSNFYSKGKPF